MDLKVIHDEIRARLNKEITGHIKSTDIDRALNLAQLDTLNMFLGSPRDYNRGRPARLYLSATQRINDALSPFKVGKSFTTTDTAGGVISLEPDFITLISVKVNTYRTSADGRSELIKSQVKLFDENEVYERLSSFLVAPSVSEPIALVNSKATGIQLFPEQAFAGMYWYIRKPAVPNFAYSMNGREVVYNESSSTQLEWYDSEIPRIIEKAIVRLAGGLKDAESAQLSMAKDGGTD